MELLLEGAATLGLRLSPHQLGQFRQYYREIVEWNSRVNLTRISEYEDVQTRHFLDSLTASLAFPKGTTGNTQVLDLGSGAGLPGLPLRIAFPELRVTLVDATAKKTAFLKHVTETLGLDDVRVITGRAEALARDPDHRECYDVVVSRALSELPVLAELALPLCRVGGLVVAQKGADIEDEVDRARSAIAITGGTLREVRNIDLGEHLGPRALVILEKSTPTPNRYPRRDGIPAKRPLRE